MKLKKVLSICKTNGLYYLYDRIDRSGEITQWLGDGYAIYPLDGLPILDEESFCAVFDITGKQREKILFRHERLPEHLNVEDVAAGDKLVREYETTFINGGLRLKPLKTNNGVTFIRSLYLSPHRHGAILRADHAAGRFVHRRKGRVPDGGGHHALCH